MNDSGCSREIRKRDGTTHPVQIERDQRGRLSELLQGDSTCDFTITCNGKSYKVHKSVLSANSLYFKALLEGITQMKEARTACVDLKEIDSSALEAALDYMYRGKVVVTWEEISEFLNVGSHLQIDGFVKLCCEFLGRELTFERISDIMQLAHTYTLLNVQHHMEDKLAHLFPAFSLTRHFHELDIETFASMAAKDCLCVRSEKWLLAEIERWSLVSDLNQEESSKVLRNVRFCLMSYDELALLSLRRVSFSDEIKGLIAAAQRYHISFNQGLPVAMTVQNRIRSTKPSLILIIEGGVNQPFEIIACQDKGDGTNACYSLYTDSSSYQTLAAVVIDNFMYLLTLEHYGGFDSDSRIGFNCFDPRRCDMRPLPFPQKQVLVSAVAAVKRKIYLCGGKSLSGTQGVSSCEAFDVDTLTWEDVSTLPYALMDSAAVGVGGYVYVSGGTRPSAIESGKHIGSANLLRLQAESAAQWETLKPMKYERRNHSMNALGSDRLVVCGGIPMYPAQVAGDSSGRGIPIEIYNIAFDEWTQVTTTLKGKSLGHFMILPDDKCIYSIGHNVHTAQEHEIWKTELDDSNREMYLEHSLHLRLTPRNSLTFAVVSYLYLNFADQQLQGSKSEKLSQSAAVLQSTRSNQ